MPVDRSRRPYESFQTLSKFRDEIVHVRRERLGFRNILEFNSLDETVDVNLLATYRVNAGTVFFIGYDDHYMQADLIEGDRDGDGIDEQLFFNKDLRRTNRAIFIKLQYLLRY